MCLTLFHQVCVFKGLYNNEQKCIVEWERVQPIVTFPQMSGRCVCKPGVLGTKCDTCPDGSTISYNGCKGCKYQSGQLGHFRYYKTCGQSYKLQLQGHTRPENTPYYDSRVIIYYRRSYIRLTTGGNVTDKFLDQPSYTILK